MGVDRRFVMSVNPQLACENASMLALVSASEPCVKGSNNRSFLIFVEHMLFKVRELLNRCSNGRYLSGLVAKSTLTDTLRFEISAEKMNQLLAQRQICAADIRCLDVGSKDCLKALCLTTCLYKVAK